MGCQGLRTGTVHTGGGTRRFGSHVTEGDNPDGVVLQQPVGLQCEGRCGTPILHWWITGRRGVGVARPSQRMGERVHALSRDERGELRDQLEGGRCVARVRGVDSVGWCVDGGAGSGIGSSNE